MCTRVAASCDVGVAALGQLCANRSTCVLIVAPGRSGDVNRDRSIHAGESLSGPEPRGLWSRRRPSVDGSGRSGVRVIPRVVGYRRADVDRLHRVRVWIANLKAVLYPENWLSPDGKRRNRHRRRNDA